jgi:hypothetical protein
MKFKGIEKERSLKSSLYNEQEVKMKNNTGFRIRENINNEPPLSESHPHLVKQWHPILNNGLTPDDVFASVGSKVWWKCDVCGYEWREGVSQRAIHGRGCGCCAGQVVVKNVNDLAKTHPHLLLEWDYEENDKLDLEPTSFSKGSHTKAHWKCALGHTWIAEINNRATKNQQCPYCTNRKVWPGFNDLATTHPNIAAEWDYKKNHPVLPTQVFGGAAKKYGFICKKCKLPYDAQLAHRTQKDRPTGCPYCAGKKVRPGRNDLATTHPELLKSWDYNKNGDLKPTDVVAGSDKQAWWTCSFGHSWKAKIAHRTDPINPTSCPDCTNRSRSSYPEQKIFYFIKKKFPDALSCYRPPWLDGKELDVYIPSKKVGIEYDGQRFHKDLIKDLLKNTYCIDNKIELIRVRETGCPPLNDGSCEFYVSPGSEKELTQCICNILEKLNVSTEIDANEFTRSDWNLLKEQLHAHK